jgi:hypothetical protein
LDFAFFIDPLLISMKIIKKIMYSFV